jgi:hypothetical protein
MATQTAREGQGPRLQALNPDLPFLASEAAIELDRVLAGYASDLTAVRQLAEQLKNAVGLPGANGGAQSLMDPATLSVLGAAVNRTSPGKQVVTVNELLTKAGSIARDLLKSDPNTDREWLEWARAFCVSLSQSAAAYRKSIYDLRPSHPFRR